MSQHVHVRIQKAALDEWGDNIVLRGVVEPASLNLLRLDSYQREANPVTGLSSVIEAIVGGQPLPDIELGMRGGDYAETKDGIFILKDPVYIIDGLQRRTGALHVLESKPDINVRLGAMIHFNTDRAWERERFAVLNTRRSKVSPNVMIRNRAEQSPVVAALYSLSTMDKAFVLLDRVCWDQRMKTGQLIGALAMAKVTSALHSHKAPTLSSQLEGIERGLSLAMENTGQNVFRSNIRTFFGLVDEFWGIKKIQYREAAIYMKSGFLVMLARFFSNHHNFWTGDGEKILFVEASLRRKIASFPIGDPNVMRLAGSGGKSRFILYSMLVDHVNSGKRTRRLTARPGAIVDPGEDNGEETNGGE